MPITPMPAAVPSGAEFWPQRPTPPPEVFVNSAVTAAPLVTWSGYVALATPMPMPVPLSLKSEVPPDVAPVNFTR